MGHHTFDDESGPQAKWDALSYKAKKPSELEPYQIDDLACGLFQLLFKIIRPLELTLISYHIIKSILKRLGLGCKAIDLTCGFLGIKRTAFYMRVKRAARKYAVLLGRRKAQ